MTRTLRVPKAVDGGQRAPGCAVKGCERQTRRDALICDVHAQALRAIPRPAAQPAARGTRGTNRNRGTR